MHQNYTRDKNALNLGEKLQQLKMENATYFLDNFDLISSKEYC